MDSNDWRTLATIIFLTGWYAGWDHVTLVGIAIFLLATLMDF